MSKDRNVFIDDDLVIVGQRASIDPAALLGYRTGRRIIQGKLVIGECATVRSGTVIYLASVIGDRLETGHGVVIREENQIGDDFQIWNNSVIDYGCTIGNNVHIHTNVYVAQFSILEDGVFLAPGVTIANDIHPGCELSRQCMRGPHLEQNVRVGINATLLPFVRIGYGALIGSGAVVTQDVPPMAVCVGNPGRIIKQTSELRCFTKRCTWPYC